MLQYILKNMYQYEQFDWLSSVFESLESPHESGIEFPKTIKLVIINIIFMEARVEIIWVERWLLTWCGDLLMNEYYAPTLRGRDNTGNAHYSVSSVPYIPLVIKQLASMVGPKHSFPALPTSGSESCPLK